MRRPVLDEMAETWWCARRAAVITALVLLVYVGVSAMAYQWRHPEETEIERFWGIWEAMQWK